ncbi:PAS domain S-box protein [Chloracidobacterium thermophilum]|uniref:histidine kinase n=1 Tax=Chloracidobacterium thermophilum (strain B) TaxID=981222 RepID=G2LI00_CHLTF|nr:PAS domain S-box protein [Chloracidobacterium thermophilum]AEP11216.1 PAS domain S-box [Chloracidobacterium thermophilum B]QUV79125.1 PAS domain S-box protein [Chloracidobacterium thermophilum]
MSNLPPTSSEFAYETAYAEALEAALAGQPALPSFFESWEADAWPPAADLIRLHTRLLQGRDDVAQERAASFLAEVLAQYDARYAALREDFASLERLTSVGTWKYDVQRQYLSWSDRALAELEMSREETVTDINLGIAHFVHPDDRERVAAAYARTVAEGAELFQEFRLLHPTQGVRHRQCRGEARRDAAGQVTQVFMVSRDVTEDVAYREHIRLLEAVLDNIHDAVLVTEAEPIDPPGPRILYVNRAFEQMTGYTALEAIGQTPRMLQGPETSAEARARIRQALQNWQPITIELINYRKDGHPFWSELAIVPIADETGYYTHWVAVQRDVTERRRIEAQQRQRSRLESVGQLSAGIAHNFNNLLAIIQGYGEMIRRDVAHSPQLLRRLESILRAVRRGSELVQELMVFSRQRDGQPQILDVCRAAQEVLDMARRLLPAEIEVDDLSLASLTGESLLAHLDASRFSQALLNLILNARDAMPTGGHLTVTVGQQTVTNALTQLTARVVYAHPPEPGDYVFVKVSDTGVGMDAETQQRIFEPFFTTKEVGRGTGLGLATVYGFVGESRGFITVDSAPREGTTIGLFFPLVQGTPAAEEASGEVKLLSALLPADATALIVEDEAELGAFLSETLSDMGFKTVHHVQDGAEAIPLTKRLGSPLALVVTDRSLPHVTGPQIIAELANRGLCERFLLISGLPGQEDLPELPPGVRLERLQKPFSVKQLYRAVQGLFRPTGAPS